MAVRNWTLQEYHMLLTSGLSLHPPPHHTPSLLFLSHHLGEICKICRMLLNLQVKQSKWERKHIYDACSNPVVLGACFGLLLPDFQDPGGLRKLVGVLRRDRSSLYPGRGLASRTSAPASDWQSSLPLSSPASPFLLCWLRRMDGQAECSWRWGRGSSSSWRQCWQRRAPRSIQWACSPSND